MIPKTFIDRVLSLVDIAEVVGRDVLWDRAKSNYARGDLYACCPFHEEKTPSFHVLRPKGVYYCFGCQAAGSAVTYLMEKHNRSFPEAIEELAEMVGETVPRDPKAEARERAARASLTLVDRAAAFYAARLGEAQAFVEDRGLTVETLARFGAGYAPKGNALMRAFAKEGVAIEALIEAGLVARRDTDAYDVFRDRLVLPVHDARGRIVSFTGRALSPDARAKWLNGPTTPAFDKSRTLFNLHRAAEGREGDEPVVMVEGAADVVALSQGGLAAVVAPLGTAVTPEHLQALWRLSDRPIVAFDGDEAGQRAAHRLARLALTILPARKTILFATMPADMDPEDLLRARGVEGVRARLARPLRLDQQIVAALIDDADLDTPEGRAQVERDARDLVACMNDDVSRKHFGRAIGGLLSTALADRPADDGRRARAEALHAIEADVLALGLLLVPDEAVEAALERIDVADGLHSDLLACALSGARLGDCVATIGLDRTVSFLQGHIARASISDRRRQDMRADFESLLAQLREAQEDASDLAELRKALRSGDLASVDQLTRARGPATTASDWDDPVAASDLDGLIARIGASG